MPWDDVKSILLSLCARKHWRTHHLPVCPVNPFGTHHPPHEIYLQIT